MWRRRPASRTSSRRAGRRPWPPWRGEPPHAPRRAWSLMISKRGLFDLSLPCAAMAAQNEGICTAANPPAVLFCLLPVADRVIESNQQIPRTPAPCSTHNPTHRAITGGQALRPGQPVCHGGQDAPAEQRGHGGDRHARGAVGGAPQAKRAGRRFVRGRRCWCFCAFLLCRWVRCRFLALGSHRSGLLGQRQSRGLVSPLRTNCACDTGRRSSQAARALICPPLTSPRLPFIQVLVIADAGAHPDHVAADLLSQAEHGPDSQARAWAPSVGT